MYLKINRISSQLEVDYCYLINYKYSYSERKSSNADKSLHLHRVKRVFIAFPRIGNDLRRLDEFKKLRRVQHRIESTQK